MKKPSLKFEKKIKVFVLLPLISLLGCRNVVKTLDDLPTPNPSKFGNLVPDNPPAAKIMNFITSVGKSNGDAYIANQVNNNLPVSQETLSDVIFQTAYEEFRKTGEAIGEAYKREMRQEAFVLAGEMINEYNNQMNNQADPAE
jgi:hypothetical protein